MSIRSLLRRLGLTWLLLATLMFSTNAADWAWQMVELKTQPNGGHRLHLIPEATTNHPAPLFRVITAPHWPADVISIFEVERDGRFELRRRPPAGRENTTDPLFFALPPEGDSNATRLAGRWQIQATNVHGGKHWTFFELTSEGRQVAGRFDQNTDYRFAFLTGGDWHTNHLRLDVEYIQDRYELTAELKDGKLIGTWRQPDDSEHGTWTGTRPAPAPTSRPSDATLGVPLWEWRRADGSRRYGIDSNWTEAGWEGIPEPLCRVWLP